jgi:Uma2 family endonuclease
MSTAELTTYTPDDLLTMPDGNRYELVDGQLVEKNMGAESDWIAFRTTKLLAIHVDDNELGDIFGSETGYTCFAAHPRMVRKPDGSFIARGRLPGGRIPKGHIPVAPDLAIEVISPNDSYYDVDAKVHLYREAGIPLIWVINPDNRTVKVYAADRDYPIELTDADELDGGDVLPGFRCRVSEIFPQSE